MTHWTETPKQKALSEMKSLCSRCIPHDDELKAVAIKYGITDEDIIEDMIIEVRNATRRWR